MSSPQSQPQPSRPPVLISQERARDVLGLKTTKTIRNMITRGQLTGFRIRGIRAVRVDLNEVRALLQVMPVAERPKPFGPNARIIDLSMDVAE